MAVRSCLTCCRSAPIRQPSCVRRWSTVFKRTRHQLSLAYSKNVSGCSSAVCLETLISCCVTRLPSTRRCNCGRRRSRETQQRSKNDVAQVQAKSQRRFRPAALRVQGPVGIPIRCEGKFKELWPARTPIPGLLPRRRQPPSLRAAPAKRRHLHPALRAGTATLINHPSFEKRNEVCGCFE
jgi:hypothetical protein